MELNQKVAVITGGGGVLCSGFAKALALEGARVAVLDLSCEKAEQVAAEIVETGGTAKAYGCDVLDKSSLKSVHERVRNDLGPCDILINGAGGNNPKATTSREIYEKGDQEQPSVVSFFDLQEEHIKKFFDLNFLGAVLPAQIFMSDMVERGTGTVLFISSMNAYRPLTKIFAYSAAKTAISNLTQWMAVHFAKSGIRVNAIAPGFICTPQSRYLKFDEDGNPNERARKILAHTPMGRFGEAEELIEPLLFLVDDERASFITGVVLPVDGGFLSYSGV